MEKFHLAKSVQDASYLTELIGGEIFRAAGVSASRIHHAVVSINGKRRGLYLMKEGHDKEFLLIQFKNNRGKHGIATRTACDPVSPLGKRSAVLPID